jgi:hypothetical protein
MNLKHGLLAVVVTVIYIVTACNNDISPVKIFSTGHTIYHLRPAKVDGTDKILIISAAFDGSVLCHSTKGDLVWKADAGGSFPFDLCVADINDDNLDETLVASGDGGIYAFSPEGKPLWVFKKERPFFQVCAAKQKNGETIILAGGVEDTLYSLSPDGTLRGKISMGSNVRNLRAGDILGDGRDLVAVSTTVGALAGTLSLALVDPTDLSIIWSRTNLGSYFPNSGRRFFSMAIVDLNHDGKKDILLSGSWGENGKIFAYDQKGELMFIKSDPRIPTVPYRMNLLVPVKLPNDEFIIGHFANILIVYNLDGSCREVITGPFAYACAAFEPVSKTLFCGSEVSGGDELVAIHLDKPGWQEAFAAAKPAGKLAKIIANLDTLKAQVDRFQRPSYQPEPGRTDMILLDEYHLRSPEDLRLQENKSKYVHYVSHVVFGQKPESDALWCRDRSAFSKYDMTADEIVAQAELWEARGWDFVVQAGHTTALHMSPSTFERILKAAPNHLWGFEFSEPGEKLDDKEREIIKKIIMPLAEQCLQNGRKKILLRTKNIFWNGSVYHPLWQRILMHERYREIFVPCLEETNSRTQELSLAGRLGLWQCGVFNHWACRAETDNACFGRSFEWSSQQVFSHHIRNLVSAASFGSDVYFNSIHQGPFSPKLERQLQPFYDMVEKGVVFIPKQEQLASLSEVAIGMHSPPAEEYLKHGTNGTRVIHPEGQPSMVFDRLDWYWGGAPLQPHDFSNYAFGVERRMFNCLPLTPYGMITIVPDSILPGLTNRYVQKISTDGRFFYDSKGNKFEPEAYREVVETALKDASSKLPVKVQGEAHWSAAWIDENHLRITLIDPGYLDPDDRKVEIMLQQDDWTECRDILGNELLLINGQSISVDIPMGSLRILDLSKK